MNTLQSLVIALGLLSQALAQIPTATYAIEIKPTENIQLPQELLSACKCESGRQFDEKGNPVKHLNENGSTDYGFCQTNSVHLPRAKQLGLDIIFKEEDNKKMALEIYRTQGIKAFNGYNPKTGTCSYYTKK